MSIEQPRKSATLTALCQRLHHTHPRFAAGATYAAQIYRPAVHSGHRR